MIPERALIVVEGDGGPVSPTQIAQEWGLGLTEIARHFRLLAYAGLIVRVGENSVSGGGGRRRGGGRRQSLYRTTDRLPGHPDGSPDPALKRQGQTFSTFITFIARLSLAINAGTLTSYVDQCFSSRELTLDQEGLDELTAGVDDLRKSAARIERDAAVRLKRSGAEAISVTLGLSAYRTPTRLDLTNDS